ncbi:MAG: hypothetical protein R2854_26935 [Caldilineaceae bacterium]
MPTGWVPASGEGVRDQRATGADAARWGRWPICDHLGPWLRRECTLYCGDADPDFDDGFVNGVHGLQGMRARTRCRGCVGRWARGPGA